MQIAGFQPNILQVLNQILLSKYSALFPRITAHYIENRTDLLIANTRDMSLVAKGVMFPVISDLLEQMTSEVINHCRTADAIIIQEHLHFGTNIFVELCVRNIAVIPLHKFFQKLLHLAGTIIPIHKGILVVEFACQRCNFERCRNSLPNGIVRCMDFSIEI